MIKLIQGNLFDYQGCIGHGVNCAGAMGAGIAKEFKRRWLDMYREYRGLCFSGSLLPGTIFPWRDQENNRWIYNLGTQDHWKTGATLEWIRKSTQEMAIHLKNHGENTVALPKIGAGLGGLRWADVFEVLSSIDLNIIIYDNSGILV